MLFKWFKKKRLVESIESKELNGYQAIITTNLGIVYTLTQEPYVKDDERRYDRINRIYLGGFSCVYETFFVDRIRRDWIETDSGLILNKDIVVHFELKETSKKIYTRKVLKYE